MKTEKMSFKNIKDVLSRDEMKGIMAGSNVTTLEYCSTLCFIMTHNPITYDMISAFNRHCNNYYC